MEQRAYIIGMLRNHHLGRCLYPRQQISITTQIGNLELQEPGLPCAEHFAWAAQFQIPT